MRGRARRVFLFAAIASVLGLGIYLVIRRQGGGGLQTPLAAPLSLTERLSTMSEERLRDEWVAEMAQFDGKIVELAGCVSPSMAAVGERTELVLVPCRYITERGWLRAPVPYSQRLYVRLRRPVHLSAGAPVSVQGLFVLDEFRERNMLWAWGKMTDAEILTR